MLIFLLRPYFLVDTNITSLFVTSSLSASESRRFYITNTKICRKNVSRKLKSHCLRINRFIDIHLFVDKYSILTQDARQQLDKKIWGDWLNTDWISMQVTFDGSTHQCTAHPTCNNQMGIIRPTPFKITWVGYSSYIEVRRVYFISLLEYCIDWLNIFSLTVQVFFNCFHYSFSVIKFSKNSKVQCSTRSCSLCW